MGSRPGKDDAMDDAPVSPRDEEDSAEEREQRAQE
jgi:hypothetical protein